MDLKQNENKYKVKTETQSRDGSEAVSLLCDLLYKCHQTALLLLFLMCVFDNTVTYCIMRLNQQSNNWN